MKKKIVTVEFSENGEEYYGSLEIECDTFQKTGQDSFEVNGAKITIDENITNITEHP